jgi:hypothetical protein
VLLEADAWFLPDTAGTSYRNVHVKSTIAVAEIDPVAQRLGYFHNQSFHVLHGNDFAGVFRLHREPLPGELPPFMEIAKQAPSRALRGATLVGASVELLRNNQSDIPAVNPFVRYALRFDAEIDILRASRGTQFHGYSFASFRQFGSAFFLGGAHLDWLADAGRHHDIGIDPAAFTAPAEACRLISSTAKTLQFRTARATIAGKPLDATPQLTTLIDAWDDVQGLVRELLR